ncbi:hypothetical protein PAXRUDRAFT_264237 [Paxillus rubicundulus Ve08.2h10]|uniref:Uncharacterized protein n=1 Tax=Paxillus rubicundulus Ve08.2h10 TaxID=930991 RepID=A0A0D0E699_9AGAM|nr:hypothetical protein PAXRUDRAFT_264237 [Paxillus rubicundulus Ve08.2h10]
MSWRIHGPSSIRKVSDYFTSRVALIVAPSPKLRHFPSLKTLCYHRSSHRIYDEFLTINITYQGPNDTDSGIAIRWPSASLSSFLSHGHMSIIIHQRTQETIYACTARECAPVSRPKQALCLRLVNPTDGRYKDGTNGTRGSVS